MPVPGRQKSDTRHHIACCAGFHDTAWKSARQGPPRFPPPRAQAAGESGIDCVVGG